jgi:hypothetical protein
MAQKLIHLFMWGYQGHYRISLRLLAENVFSKLGIRLKPKTLLVGVRGPGSKNPHPVCVEPENDQWPLLIRP